MIDRGEIMAQKVSKKYILNIKGVVEIYDGRINVCVEDHGEFDLADLMKTFDGNECNIAVSYDEEYAHAVDADTSEVI